MDNRIAPIESFVKEGLVVNFRRVFGCDLVVTNQSNKREIANRRAQGKPLTYPLAFAELQTLALPTTPNYRAAALLRRGVTGLATTDNLGSFKVSMIPIESTYQILYITNSFTEAEKFGKLWLMSAAAGFLKFDVMYGVVNVGVTLELERQVSLPQRDASPDTTEEYEVTTSLVLSGYASHDQLMNEQAANAVEVSAEVTNEIEKALTQEGSAGNVEVFRFKREWPVGIKGPLTR